MGNLYMIYPFSTQLRTINIQRHSRKQWMLCVNLNLNHRTIMIKVTHKNRIKIEVVSEINQMKQFLHKHRNMKNAIAVFQ